MPEKVQGIVLDYIQFKESSGICKVFTKQYGLLSILVNGIGRKNSNFSGAYLQTLTIVEFVLYIKEAKGIYKSKDFLIIQSSFGPLPNIVKTSISQFISEVVLLTLKESHPEQELFLLLENSVYSMNVPDINLNSLHLYFLCSYLRILGFSMEDVSENNITYTHRSEGTDLIEAFSRMKQYSPVETSKKTRKIILDSILRYLYEKIDMPAIRSLAILEEVMV